MRFLTILSSAGVKPLSRCGEHGVGDLGRVGVAESKPLDRVSAYHSID